MTRKEWLEQMSQIGWEMACHEQYDRECRQKLMERLDQLQAHEPKET